MLASAWTFGWEALVALGTLTLASVTGGLAWSTRRLARETAEEVRGQTRPVVVPRGSGAAVGREALHGGGGYYLVTVCLHNIGAGPALNFSAAIGPGSYLRKPVAALGAGAEHDAVVRVPIIDNEGAYPFHNRTRQLTLEYHDLAGRVFVTEIGLSSGLPNPAGYGFITTLSPGSAPQEAPFDGPMLAENPLSAARARRHRTTGVGVGMAAFRA